MPRKLQPRIFELSPLPPQLPFKSATNSFWRKHSLPAALGGLPGKVRHRAFVGDSTEWAETLTILKKIMLLARIRADPMQPARVYRPSASGFQ